MTHITGPRARIVKPLDAKIRMAIDIARLKGATTSEMRSVLGPIDDDLVTMLYDEIDRLKRKRRR